MADGEDLYTEEPQLGTRKCFGHLGSYDCLRGDHCQQVAVLHYRLQDVSTAVTSCRVILSFSPAQGASYPVIRLEHVPVLTEVKHGVLWYNRCPDKSITLVSESVLGPRSDSSAYNRRARDMRHAGASAGQCVLDSPNKRGLRCH